MLRYSESEEPTVVSWTLILNNFVYASVMSYRTTELYAMAILIFAPSPRFYMNYEDPDLKTLGLGWDRTR